MAIVNHSFHVQRIFLILGILVSVLALGIIVYSSQKPTNTQSDASGGCIMTPKIKLISSNQAPVEDWGVDYVYQYKLRISNESTNNCSKVLYWISQESAPNKNWIYAYESHVNEGEWINIEYAYDFLFPKQVQNLLLNIYPRETRLKKGTYKLPVKVCRTFTGCGDGGYCGTRDANLAAKYINGVTTSCSTINVEYIKK